MKLLVVGDTGFLASNFIKQFKDEYEITGLNRSNFKFDQAAYKEVLNKNFDLILFTAAQSSAGVSWKEAKQTILDNVRIFIDLLLVLRKDKIKHKIIYFSSAEVYGSYDRLIKEEDNFNPMNPYAISKVALENIVKLYRNEGLNIKTVRPFPIIGPGQRLNFALPNFIKQIKQIQKGEIEPIIKHGNLSAKRDFTDVRYFGSVINHLIKNFDALKHNEYNVCSGKRGIYSIKEILDLLVKCSGVDIELQLDQSRVRPNDLPLLVGDDSRLMEEVEITSYSIENTIKYILQSE